MAKGHRSQIKRERNANKDTRPSAKLSYARVSVTKACFVLDAIRGKKEVIHRHGVNKAQKGHFEKAGVSCKRYVREFRFENASEYALAQEIKADIFAAGDRIDATAISKGKGFQGAIKRFGQHRGPMAHGSKFHRHQGSNGACSSPSRVFKGKGMPGHMGCVKVTVQNLDVVRVDADKNLILVKGAVPGPKKALVTFKETVKVEA